MANVSFRGVEKNFGKVKVIHGITFDIADGEFVVLVGPSGCGKSTLLRMLAGLEPISGGEIGIGDRVINDVDSKDRDIAMVFQSYALYPHMTVRENMGFSLKLRKADQKVVDERVRKAAEILNLKEYLNRYPRQLSGGQRQRVAMGRAIVRDPQVFLFDEPLSNLDAKLRVQMRSEIKELHQRLRTTSVYVTHDQIEAMTMADKIVVMHDGIVEQAGAPLELYDRPANTFVATFIGSPAMNMLDGQVGADGASVVVADGTAPPWEPASFDRVLVDAPCTGLGALRRRPEARWRRQPADLDTLVPLQRALLSSALDSVRPGGVVLYATCSPVLQETAIVVDTIRQMRGDVVLEDASALLAQVPDCEGPVPGTIQLWPHRHGTDAMFMALFRRQG